MPVESDLFHRPRRTLGRRRKRIAVGPFSELVPERDVVSPSIQRRDNHAQVRADSSDGPAGRVQDGDAHGACAARRSARMCDTNRTAARRHPGRAPQAPAAAIVREQSKLFVGKAFGSFKGTSETPPVSTQKGSVR